MIGVPTAKVMSSLGSHETVMSSSLVAIAFAATVRSVAEGVCSSEKSSATVVSAAKSTRAPSGCVGAEVGAVVGAEDGVEVGTDVGAEVGTGVVGVEVGAEVGTLVGDEVGIGVVGVEVGTEVGTLVGDEAGYVVGVAQAELHMTKHHLVAGLSASTDSWPAPGPSTAQLTSRFAQLKLAGVRSVAVFGGNYDWLAAYEAPLREFLDGYVLARI